MESVVPAIFSSLCHLIASQLDNIFKFKNNLEDLQKAVDDLERARLIVNPVTSLMEKLVVGEDEKALLVKVQSWLTTVQDIEKEVDDELQKFEDRRRDYCFLRGLWSKYLFGEKVVKLLRKVNSLSGQAGDIKEMARMLRDAAEKATVRNQNVSLDGAVLNNSNITVVQE